MEVIFMKKRVLFTALGLVVLLVSQAMSFDWDLDLPKDYNAERVTKLLPVKPGETRTFLDLEGPGCIKHIWITTNKGNDFRGIVIRMYWDGEEEPSVEAPLADFFGVGHNQYRTEEWYANPCLALNPFNGYNCYFPMPFAKHAKITVTNDQDVDIKGWFYFQADYQEYKNLPKSVPYFHAQWRREAPALRRGRPFTIVQAVGKGFLAGITYHIRVDDTADDWCHGGGDIVYIDAEDDPGCINGIGGEDYFGASWGIDKFISQYAGCTINSDGLLSMYRFYLENPVPFEKSVRLAFNSMGNEITSVGYWYQAEPHQRYFNMPPMELRAPDSRIEPGSYDIELLPDEQIDLAVIGPFKGDIDTVFAPEEKIDLAEPVKTNFEGPYKTDHPGEDDRLVQWERGRTTLGWLDFEALYRPKMVGPRGVRALAACVGYGYIRVHSDKRRTCRMYLGNDDPARVWLNGEQVADLPGKVGFDGKDVKLKLQKGWNDVLIKVSNFRNENWSVFAASIVFPDRKGLKFNSFAELPENPEYARPPAE